MYLYITNRAARCVGIAGTLRRVKERTQLGQLPIIDKVAPVVERPVPHVLDPVRRQPHESQHVVRHAEHGALHL